MSPDDAGVVTGVLLIVGSVIQGVLVGALGVALRLLRSIAKTNAATYVTLVRSAHHQHSIDDTNRQIVQLLQQAVGYQQGSS